MDRTLRVWEVASGASRVLEGHTKEVTALAVLPDGRGVSGSFDKTLRVWDVDSGASRALEGHTDGVRVLAVLPDGRVVSGSGNEVGSGDLTMRVWEVARADSGSVWSRVSRQISLLHRRKAQNPSGIHSSGASRVLEGHTREVRALAVLPDGRVVSGSDDRTLRVWDVASGASRVLEGHTREVRALAVLPDGRVVSGSDDWAVILWDLETANSMSAFVSDAAIIACVAARVDCLVVGSANGAVHIMEVVVAPV